MFCDANQQAYDYAVPCRGVADYRLTVGLNYVKQGYSVVVNNLLTLLLIPLCAAFAVRNAPALQRMTSMRLSTARDCLFAISSWSPDEPQLPADGAVCDVHDW